MMGYAEECETTVLELTDNDGVKEYIKGNASAQVRIVFLQKLQFVSFNSVFCFLHLLFFILRVIDECGIILGCHKHK